MLPLWIAFPEVRSEAEFFQFCEKVWDWYAQNKTGRSDCVDAIARAERILHGHLNDYHK